MQPKIKNSGISGEFMATPNTNTWASRPVANCLNLVKQGDHKTPNGVVRLHEQRVFLRPSGRMQFDAPVYVGDVIASVPLRPDDEKSQRRTIRATVQAVYDPTTPNHPIKFYFMDYPNKGDECALLLEGVLYCYTASDLYGVHYANLPDRHYVEFTEETQRRENQTKENARPSKRWGRNRR